MLTKKVIRALTSGKEIVREEADIIKGGQVLDYETKQLTRTGKEEGRVEEHAEIQNVYAWLVGLNRVDDISKAATDENYYQKVLAEYKETNGIIDKE